MKCIGLICNNEQEFLELTNKISGVLSRTYSKTVVWNVITKTSVYKIVSKPTRKFQECLKYPGEILKYNPSIKKENPSVKSYPNEIWKEYKGYQISTYGRVINKWGKLSSIYLYHNYWYVKIEQYSHPVHIIMAKVFLKKNHENNRFVDHIDGDILNNYIDNLRWRIPVDLTEYNKLKSKNYQKRKSYEKLWARLLHKRDHPPKSKIKKKYPSKYKAVVATKRHCLHCGTEFLGKGKKKYCKSSHTPATYNAKSIRKRLDKGSSKRIPKWEDKLLLAQYIKNKPPGTQVDHIIPLNHPDVCGLHCRDNLQYLSPEENNLKSNRFDGTKENEGWRLLS